MWRGELDGTKVDLHLMKEPDYVMMFMSTYGTLKRLGEPKKRGDTTIRYTEVIHTHYSYRDSINSHNGMRMFPVVLKETWKTTRWPLRVFQFLLAITEVNIKLAYERIFKQPEVMMMTFCQAFAHKLIYNDYLEEENAKNKKRQQKDCPNIHELVSLPP